MRFAQLQEYAKKCGLTLYKKGNNYTLQYTYPPHLEINGCTHLRWVETSSTKLKDIHVAIQNGYLCKGQKTDLLPRTH